MKKLLTIASLLVSSNIALADQVFVDNVIVQGSECVGVDCNNGLNFGFDTFVLKENNLRMFFDDTSSSGSFPNVDWRFTFNDSSNGGSNYFSVDNATNNVTPFKILSGAGNNAMVIDADGDIGIGTSSPIVELQVTDGDSPTLRLEQNGSSGFTAQTWDVAGNEANFFVRDVTNSSKLPFKIIPGSSDNNLVVTGGKVGINTKSADATLHVKETDGTAQIKIQEGSSTKTARDLLLLENNGNPQIQLYHTGNGNKWYISAGLNFVIKNTLGNTVFKVTPEGDVIFKKSDDTTDVSLQALVDFIETTHNTTIPSTTP